MVTSERCWWSRNRPSPSPSPLLLQPRPRLSMTARGEGFRFSCDARVVHRCGISGRRGRKASFVFCYMDDSSGVRATGGESSDATGSTGLQLYSQIERCSPPTAAGHEGREDANRGGKLVAEEEEGHTLCQPLDGAGFGEGGLF
ncbi:hypothetical protein Taro_031497 [Colocasia esculenta]|uniref:Uncharacterized protein n=1 Tax=Colocasia esculenta TaxID=4460 RepID=A0A843W135_COLES|nr:hypothetical protein [Colocasia esculenta]